MFIQWRVLCFCYWLVSRDFLETKTCSKDFTSRVKGHNYYVPHKTQDVFSSVCVCGICVAGIEMLLLLLKGFKMKKTSNLFTVWVNIAEFLLSVIFLYLIQRSCRERLLRFLVSCLQFYLVTGWTSSFVCDPVRLCLYCKASSRGPTRSAESPLSPVLSGAAALLSFCVALTAEEENAKHRDVTVSVLEPVKSN